MRRRALLVSAYFLPSNLAGVQRTRLIADALEKFGWDAIIVTVDPAYYEEPNDNASLALLSKNLRVERVKALPAVICRLLGFGDISLRAQWQLRHRVADLIQHKKVDLIFATVLPGYTSLVGAWAKRRFNVPFVLDYQDPWVSDWGRRQSRLSKAGLAHWLATKLEPSAVATADALTAVSDETLRTLKERGLVQNGLPVEIIPIGADARDHEVAAKYGYSFLTKKVGEFALAYLGTITQRMLPSVRTLFCAARQAIDSNPQMRLTLHFIGTSAQPNGKDVHNLTKLAQDCRIDDRFRLEPRRVGYLDALRTMQDADALLLIGSTDSHYTASKIFPYWLSRKPVFALFHAGSTVNDLARELGGVRVVNYDESDGPETRVSVVASMFRQLMEHRADAVPPRNEGAFEPYSARSMARRYAALFDRVSAGEN